MSHRGATSRTEPKLVVGVGASAGGFEAFKELLSALPADGGVTFVFVQHLDRSHESVLAALLTPYTEMPVREADDGMQLEANAIYVIRPNTALAVRGGRIELSAPKLHRGVRLPVDHLFRSLARDYGERAVGIVLSGAGSDGSAGIRDIKAAGGLTIAQDPKTSGQAGMPQGAIDTGLVDLVLDIGKIPAALQRFASLPVRARIEAPFEDQVGEMPERPRRLDEQQFERLAAILDSQLSFDLRLYKPATIERRVLRRMALSGFEDTAAYFEYLQQHLAERRTLVRDFLISVTDFFRDIEAFRALREVVIDPLVARASPGTTLRAWVPGCATGEEAYSIGMEFLDAIVAHDKRVNLQVFATDVDADALAFGRAAVYPASIAEQVSEQRLQTYFKRLDDSTYEACSPLRDVVSFAAHDLARDPPFSRMNLVSCRNVLIYLTAEAQDHVLKVLHFALEPDGYLFLSASESTGQHRDLFATISKTQRIYRKVGISQPVAVARSRSRPPPDQKRGQSPASSSGGARRATNGDLARRAVLQALVPATVVVSGDGAILFSHGELSPYLRIPEGDDPRLDLGSMLRPEIATRARGALFKCRRRKEPVVSLSSAHEQKARVRLCVHPAPSLGDDTVIITFEEVAERGAKELDEPSAQPGGGGIVEQLEKELWATREDLRNAVEELEGVNEELRSSNEESRAVNEELQSANEELEATTEELRSLNEELTTVNAQLREKVEQVEQAHDDLHNFLSSTKIATIFLDDDLRIKRFTPAAGELLGIDEADVGRSITAIARELLQYDLEREARTLLRDFTTSSRELHTAAGRWIARQVLPYRTESRQVEGVVVTFADVTDLKSATERLAMRERQQAIVARIGLHALRETDLLAFMNQVVRDVQQTLDTDHCKILELQPDEEKLLLRAGVGWKPGLVGSAEVSTGLDSQAGYTLQSDEPVIVEDLAREKRFSGPRLLVGHGIKSGVSCAIRDGDHCYGVIGAHTTTRRVFDAEDASFLQAVANVVGSAVGRHQMRRRLALEHGVAQAIASTKNLDDALTKVIESFARELGISVGEAWWPNDGRGHLECRLRHVVSFGDGARVGEGAGPGPLGSGEGLAGRVFADGVAAWVADLGDSGLLAQDAGTQEHEPLTGIALPIRSGNEVLGVLALFAEERLPPDEAFLRSVEGIGRSLGDFVARLSFEQRERRLASITESSQDAILSYDHDWRIVEWLAGAERLFGYSADEMIGASLERIVPENRREELRQINDRIRQGQLMEAFETVRARKDGSLVEVSVRVSPVRNEEGEIAGFSASDRDITRLKEVEHRLLEADRQKDEFIAMLGHELRNPLAAIRSASELLKLLDGDPVRLARTQAIIERQSGHMAKLLDGLLDVSRIIRGKIRVERDVVDFAGICREVASDATERLAGRALDIRLDLPSDPVWVEGDRVRLTQVVDNLLSNAVKYTTDGGSITLLLTQADGAALLNVRDTGVGIEPDLLPNIFDVFRQADQTLERSGGGLGLGLALVKSLVELHGGRVEARSDGRDEGSEFTVSLPTTRRVGASRRKGSSESREPQRILIIEDNEDSAEMLRQVLQLSGYDALVANRGKQGLEMASTELPDLVLCDLGLPDGMSGFDVARALRADINTRDLRLVALTGYGRPEDKARCEEAGFDAHLTKPIDLKAVERILTEMGVGPARAAPSRTSE